jgi:hypothetical protein
MEAPGACARLSSWRDADVGSGPAVTRDFYDTMAQVLPVLLLALIWDSAYLDRLREQRRVLRRLDPDGVRFWTHSRVRIYILTLAVAVIVSIALTIMVLADLIPDSTALRIILCGGLFLVLATLLTRIYYDVIAATSTTEKAAEKPVSVGPGPDEIHPPMEST